MLVSVAPVSLKNKVLRAVADRLVLIIERPWQYE